MRISLVVGIISLLLAAVFFVIFSVYENHMYKKDESYKDHMYVGTFQEVIFILFLIFATIFSICLFLNFSYIFKAILGVLANLLNI